MVPLNLQLNLSTTLIGKRFYHYDEVTSTNDIAIDFASLGVEEGSVVIAESQTKGKGRLGKSWISPSGVGLYFSIILNPSLPLKQIPLLTLAAGVAAARAIAEITHLRVFLKWPNDIMIGGKKAGGILAEARIEGDTIKVVVIGIGVNVNTPLSQFPEEVREHSTSLSKEASREIDRSLLLAKILETFDGIYLKVINQEHDEILQAWRTLSNTLGEEVLIQSGSERIEGKAVDIDWDGSLLVRTEKGTLEKVASGEATVIKRGENR
ncbi:MAG: biotin--[acetyl-CoA-carboxylase] ligase [Candidatus Tectomicrobia bacterium]|nr:biotin--[acetyl-CoA-carboxylase] ligase [Candidatus Tectomicrobia bacterium]